MERFLVPVLVIVAVLGLVVLAAFWMARQSPGPEANGFDSDTTDSDYDDTAPEPV